MTSASNDKRGEYRVGMTNDSDPLSDALIADAAELSARLFAEVFGPGATSPQPFRTVLKSLSRITGVVPKRHFLTVDTMSEAVYADALEIVLRWEAAYLAARAPVGDQGLFLVLLREGEAVRASADPHAAALLRLRAADRR